jgi:hypothetical protein
MDTLQLVIQLLAGFIFLFQIFRLLQKDYPEEQIVKASVLGISLAVGFGYLNKYLGLNLIVFELILTSVLVVYIFCLSLDWRFWPVLELITWPGLVCLAVAFAGQLQGIVYLLAILVSFYWKNYRNFFWYPSGRVGFFFLINLNFIAFFHLVLDFWQQRLVELIVWSVVLLLGISGIVLLSGREKKD